MAVEDKANGLVCVFDMMRLLVCDVCALIELLKYSTEI